MGVHKKDPKTGELKEVSFETIGFRMHGTKRIYPKGKAPEALREALKTQRRKQKSEAAELREFREGTGDY